MSQNWAIEEIIPGSTPPATDITKLTDALASLKSAFIGASLPTTNLVEGMLAIKSGDGSKWIRNTGNTDWEFDGYITNALTATTRAATTTLATSLNHTLSDTSATITAFHGVAGVTYHCRALGAESITHHATDLIVTQGGADITTEAGATFDIEMITGTTCRLKNYQRAQISVTPNSLQLQSAIHCGTTGGSSTAYTCAATPAIAANTAKTRIRAILHTAVGTTPTLAVNGLTALPIKYQKIDNTLLSVTAYEVVAGVPYDFESDGTNWVVLNPNAIGLTVSSTVTFGNAISLTIATNANVTSITLPTGGLWDVTGTLCLSGNSSTTMTYLIGSLSLVSATLNSTPGSAIGHSPRSDSFALTSTNHFPFSTIQVAGGTTVYLVAHVGFATSTCSAFGKIQAKRASI